jgi:hypothetical protein
LNDWDSAKNNLNLKTDGLVVVHAVVLLKTVNTGTGSAGGMNWISFRVLLTLLTDPRQDWGACPTNPRPHRQAFSQQRTIQCKTSSIGSGNSLPHIRLGIHAPCDVLQTRPESRSTFFLNLEEFKTVKNKWIKTTQLRAIQIV